MDYRRWSWTIMDYRGLLNMHHHKIGWVTIVDYHGLSWIATYAPRASDDTWKVWRGYGAYCSLHRSCAILLHGLSYMIVSYALQWLTMSCHGLSWIRECCRLAYHGVWTVMNHHWLSRLIVDYYGSWTIMDCHGLSWIINDCNGLWTMVDYHGLR